MSGSIGYHVQLRISGVLSPTWWSAVFAGVAVEPEPGGTTLLSGDLPDQAALHGLLAAIRDRGLTLLSAETVALGNTASGAVDDETES